MNKKYNIYMYIKYICIYRNSTMKIFSHCFIKIDVCAKAMEPAITTPTLHPITILATRTILFAYLKNASKNCLKI